MPGETYTYYAMKPCGCLAFAAIDNPRNAVQTGNQARRSIKRGETVNRVLTGKFRNLPWTCANHKIEEITAAAENNQHQLF